MTTPRPYPYLFGRETTIGNTPVKLPLKHGRSSTKIMLTLREENFLKLTQLANERDISVQELIRAVIIPEWTKAPVLVSSAPMVSWRTPQSR